MKLYQVKFDSSDYWIEAESFGDAVAVWTEHVRVAFGIYYDGDEEPESVYLVSNDPVIRRVTDKRSAEA